MKHCWLLLFAIFGLGCHRDLPQVQAPSINPEVSSSYIKAATAKERSFTVTIQAPADHPLFLENCNGAINWGLAVPGTQGKTLAWLVMRDACSSAPIEVKPGASRSFLLEIAGNDMSAPARGQYQLVLLGVFPTWSESQPMHSPQVPRERLLSSPVFMGP